MEPAGDAPPLTAPEPPSAPPGHRAQPFPPSRCRTRRYPHGKSRARRPRPSERRSGTPAMPVRVRRQGTLPPNSLASSPIGTGQARASVPCSAARRRDRLLQPCRAALPPAEHPKRDAEIILRHRPFERHPLARPLLQRRAIRRDRLLEPRRAAPPPPSSKARCRDCSESSPSRAALSAGRSCSAARYAGPPPPAAPCRLARAQRKSALPRLSASEPIGAVLSRASAPSARRERLRRLLQPCRAALPLAEVQSALPRLFCVTPTGAAPLARPFP